MKAFGLELFIDTGHRFEFDVGFEDALDMAAFVFFDDELTTFESGVAVGGGGSSAGPKSFFGDHFLMASVKTFFDVFAFKLGEDGEDSNGRTSKWSLSINRFTKGDKLDVMREEEFLDEREGVSLGATETIESVDDNEVNFFHLDILDELLHRGAFEGGPTVSAIDVFGDVFPPFGRAVGLESFSLDVESIFFDLLFG